jgi:hypothetical protein
LNLLLDRFSELVSFFIVSKDHLIVLAWIDKYGKKFFFVQDKLIEGSEDSSGNLSLFEDIIEFSVVGLVFFEQTVLIWILQYISKFVLIHGVLILVALNIVSFNETFLVLDLVVANSSEQELIAHLGLKSFKIALLRVSIEVVTKKIPESHEVQRVRKVVN